jgi:hypothetical protein
MVLLSDLPSDIQMAVSNSAAALFVCRYSTGTPFITYEEERFMVELSDAGDVVGIDSLTSWPAGELTLSCKILENTALGKNGGCASINPLYAHLPI